MKLSIISLAGVIGVQAAAIKAKPSFPIKHFKDFVAFGDSYSSQAGAGGIPITFTGGHVWPGFVADSTRVTLYDFAVAGAVCSDVYKNPGSSNRSREIQDQIPAWLGTANATHLNAGTTVYSNWIGTNDLGYDGFLGASEPKGYNITSFVECNWDVMDVIYANGGRYFVVLNTAPLELTTLYAAIGENGVGNNHYWKNKVNTFYSARACGDKG